MIKNLLIEVCCGTIDDCITAIKMNADRIELNCALELGGLTPSLATLIKTKQLSDVPVICMVRPRHKGFAYSDSQFEIMLEDAKILLDNGADGIAFGFLDTAGNIDQDRTRVMCELIGDRQKVFHKAIDETKDLSESLEILISLGVDRVLTSGLNTTIQNESLPYLKDTIAKYQERIDILLGSGISEDNVLEIVNQTKTKSIHLTAKELKYDSSTHNYKQKNRGLVDYSYFGVSEERLATIYKILKENLNDR